MAMLPINYKDSQVLLHEILLRQVRQVTPAPFRLRTDCADKRIVRAGEGA